MHFGVSLTLNVEEEKKSFLLASETKVTSQNHFNVSKVGLLTDNKVLLARSLLRTICKSTGDKIS